MYPTMLIPPRLPSLQRGVSHDPPEVSESKEAYPTMLIALIPVMAVIALREWIEDRSRKRADRLENNRLVERISPHGEATTAGAHQCRWRAIRVGDVIRVHKGERFPCDLLLLASSDANHGQAYVETKDLDGETNLKTKTALRSTAALLHACGPAGGVAVAEAEDAAAGAAAAEADAAIGKINLRISYEKPNNNLYNFNGQIFLGDKMDPLSADQLLLKGSSLQTDWVIGCAVGLHSGAHYKNLPGGVYAEVGGSVVAYLIK